MADALLDDLDERQRAAVTSTSAPLAILAPAGSGKTRVLTRRIAYRVREQTADARHVLAVTFTRRAAAELVDRIGRLVDDRTVTAGTFHALALAQLRRLAADRGREPPRVVADKSRLVKPLLRSGRAPGGGGAGGGASGVAVADVVAEIEWAKARMVTPDRFAAAAHAAGRRLPCPAPDLADVYDRYERDKRTRHVVDFDDLLSQAADAFDRDADFASGQRWRFRHLFVDEFQDATPLQLRVLRAWLADRDDLCVVGDPAQAIYGFAGADAAPLADFDRFFPGGATISLTRNHRSTARIVAFAESALGARAGVTRDAPVATRSSGNAPTIVEYADGAAEAAGVADACWRAFTRGVPWDRIAILCRTNAQAAAFQAACTRRGVPCASVSTADGERFARRDTVRSLLESLRERQAAAPGRAFADHLADLAADPGVDPDVDEDVGGGPAPGTPPDGLERDRARLLELGREYVALEGNAGGVAGFAAWLDQATRASTPHAAVELVTFHRAKGLEWEVVFVTGLERGLVPIAWAESPAAIAEERRLLHVALTRATDELSVSWAHVREGGSRTSRREPSPWLTDLAATLRGMRGAPVDPRRELATVRATLAAATPAPPRVRRTRR